MNVLKVNFQYYIIISFLSIILFSCGNDTVEKFSKTKPYAIQIKKERSYFQAEKLSSRLKKMGIESYISQYSDSIKDDGDWYCILSGGIETLDSAKSLRTSIEKEFNLENKNLEIASFSNFKNVNINPDLIKASESKRIKVNRPDIKDDIIDVLEKFPVSNKLFIQSASVISSPSEKGEAGFGHVYSMKLDLPRGVKKKLLLKKTTNFTEVIYKDNLYGDKVVIEIGKLKKSRNQTASLSIINLKNNDCFKIAEEYADLILNTGEYLFEEKKEIEVDSYTKLYGYKVSIEIRKNYFRTYLILVDESAEYVIFSQSIDKTEKELLEILTDIGKDDGLMNYDEFYNVFNTIPEKLVEGDKFIGFTISKIDWSYAKNKGYAKWAKAFVGHWAANGFFYNSKKGLWTFGIFDTLTKDKRKNIDSIYEKTTNNKKIDIYNTIGYLVYEKKFNSKTWKYYKRLREINFGINRYKCMIDNTNNSWLNKDEMILRAEGFQLKKEAIQ